MRALGDDRGAWLYLGAVLVNEMVNMAATPRLRAGAMPRTWMPSVVVLVPARNEERNIERCVRSLLGQTWPRLRVAVLDDGSTDRTGALLARLQEDDGRLTVIAGREPPAGWTGKAWACRQLAEFAGDTEVLIFADADTWHEPGMVGAVLATMEAAGLDLLSAVPRQEIGSAWERWTVPVIPWALVTHLSPAMARALGLPLAAGAIGQVLAFRREAYERLGGHDAVRAAAAEDMAFARLATRRRLRWAVAAAQDVSACRMYRDRAEAFAGLEKNLYPALGGRPTPFLFVWVWLTRVFTWPWAVAVWQVARGRPRTAGAAALLGVAGMGTWLLAGRRFAMDRRTVIESPVAVTVGAWLALRSLVAWRRGRAVWKGRRLG